MRRLIPVYLLMLLCTTADANPLRNRPLLRRTNGKLAGTVLDYTRNHGADNRLWSNALCSKRDLYVYLPPCYNPNKLYPLVIWVHGFAQEETSFLKDVIPPLDEAMASGEMPPAIIAAPDGSIHGRACAFTNYASFFIDSKAGNFEDYLMVDTWDFLHHNFPIRPERDAHFIAGVSMGGGVAFNKAFKYRDRFKVVVGIFPPVNTRWENCKGRYRANFDPNDWNFRTNYNKPCEPVARFYGFLTIRLGTILRPLYGRDRDIADRVAAENPLELMVGKDIKNGEFAMFIAYGGKDEFNMDAQVESFLYVAKQRGIDITVAYDPKGRHDAATAKSFLPAIRAFLVPQMEPFRQ